jgi:hypothetical protein
MNALSHVCLSLVFKKAIEARLPVKLPTISFIKGNLKPDFSLLVVKVPHYKIPTSDIVKREVDKLMQYMADHDSFRAGEFAERLGVITHYLADFFCYAHSTRFTGSLYDHVVYERNLSRYRKAMKARILESAVHAARLDPGMDCRSICERIDKLYFQYCSLKPSYAHDLFYTLRAGIPLAVALISSCPRPEERKIAA